jgi:hypothetical protein
MHTPSDPWARRRQREAIVVDDSAATRMIVARTLRQAFTDVLSPVLTS